MRTHKWCWAFDKHLLFPFSDAVCFLIQPALGKGCTICYKDHSGELVFLGVASSHKAAETYLEELVKDEVANDVTT